MNSWSSVLGSNVLGYLLALAAVGVLLAVALRLLNRSAQGVLQKHLDTIIASGLPVSVRSTGEGEASLDVEGQEWLLKIVFWPTNPAYWQISLSRPHKGEGKHFWLTSNQGLLDLFGERGASPQKSGDPAFDDTFLFGGDEVLVHKATSDDSLRQLMLAHPKLSVRIVDGRLRFVHVAYGHTPPEITSQDWVQTFGVAVALSKAFSES